MESTYLTSSNANLFLTLSFNSIAAFLLYAITSISFSKHFYFLTKYPILPIIVEVFPVPAPAIIRFLF